MEAKVLNKSDEGRLGRNKLKVNIHRELAVVFITICLDAVSITVVHLHLKCEAFKRYCVIKVNL